MIHCGELGLRAPQNRSKSCTFVTSMLGYAKGIKITKWPPFTSFSMHCICLYFNTFIYLSVQESQYYNKFQVFHCYCVYVRKRNVNNDSVIHDFIISQFGFHLQTSLNSFDRIKRFRKTSTIIFWSQFSIVKFCGYLI